MAPQPLFIHEEQGMPRSHRSFNLHILSKKRVNVEEMAAPPTLCAAQAYGTLSALFDDCTI